MKKKTKKFKFNGWDWSEMFNAANLELGMKLKSELTLYTTMEAEEKFLDAQVAEFFKDCEEWDNKKNKYGLSTKGKVIHSIIQRFFEKFLPAEKKYHYHYPLWVGLSKIKDEECFLKYCQVLFRFMWN